MSASASLAVAVLGSSSPTSSSGRLAAMLLERLAEDGWATETIAPATLPAEALLGLREDPMVQEAISLAQRSRILVLASPVYRGTYTGMLKCFFDLLPPHALAGCVCIPVLTGSGYHHLLAIDHGVRPLVASLGGMTTASGLYATSEDWAEEMPTKALVEQLGAAAQEAGRLARALAER